MQETMLKHTQVDLPAVQIGEPFHCWQCGSPDQGGIFLKINHSPLEIYSNAIYYMRLVCGHNPRCVRLGDAIAPLRPLDRSMDENLASVQVGLAGLARVIIPIQPNQEPVSKIVYLLVAGRISPQTAINRLGGLITTSQLPTPANISANTDTWR